MAETLISPGVLALENDNSFVSSQPVTVGAAIIGPTVKGPVEVPTIVTSYSDYQNKFGTTFISGGQVYSYFTSIAAFNYFNNGGQTLLVSRVVTGSFTEATSSISNGTLLTTASANFDVTYVSASVVAVGSGSFSINDIQFFFTGANATNTANIIYVNTSSFASSTATDYAFTASAVFNVSKSISPYNTLLSDITASNTTNTLNLTAGLVGGAYNYITLNNYTYISGSTTYNFSGATGVSALTIKTISEGEIMNNSGTPDISGSLISGSVDNVRWQVSNYDTSSGTFSLLVRQGDDNTNNPIVLETWTNLSMDPTAPNYVARVIGNQFRQYNDFDNQIEVVGDYPNNSRYIYVSAVNTPTPLYFDNNGLAKAAYTASIPVNANGTFGGATGKLFAGAGTDYYNNIDSTTTAPQGISASAYTDMIRLMGNSDDYRYNVLLTPGLFASTPNLGSSQVTTAINNTQNRGDSIYVVDLVPFNSSISEVTTQANAKNTSYAAAYWPWVQTIDPDSAQLVWVPASTMVGGVYAYNDNVSEPWFAPAGINRGGLSQVVRAEKKLSQANRDTLYTNKVNPIATFPGTGVVVYGQKTLQTRASALDRVNVRRLLIQLKSYISQVAQNLVFEQNTIATRNQFLSQVNPYLESVQQRQGLYAFKVIMDDSNNTADVIDRNQMVGQIYIQPTKTAEFIYLDFNILPTGATFPA
jgi:phage tail sheath protein FI